MVQNMINRRKALKQLLDGLRNASIGQKYHGLKNLMAHCREEQENDRARERAVKLMCRHLKNSSYKQMHDAYRKLHGKSSSFGNGKKVALPYVLDKITKSRYQNAFQMMKLDSRVETYRLYLNGLMKWRMSNSESRAETDRLNHGNRMAAMMYLLYSVEKVFNTELRNSFDKMNADENNSKLEVVLARATERYRKKQSDVYSKMTQYCLSERTKDE